MNAYDPESLPYRGSAGMHWRSTSLIELCQAIDYCISQHGVAHVYLHAQRWAVVGEPRNGWADDHVGTWRRVPRERAAAQHVDIDRKATDALRAEALG